MLILTRKVGEEIVIAEDIVVKVVSIDRNKVRLGVSAHSAVKVDRKEVHERKAREHESGEAKPKASDGRPF